MLLAAGSVAIERWLAAHGSGARTLGRTLATAGLALAWAVGGALSLPVAPVQSPLWEMTSKVQDNFAEEIGWTELVETTAGIYAGLPANGQSGILAGNYGEAGAIDLYGPAYGLPRVISGVDSYWLRGYPDPPPRNLVVLGYSADELSGMFETCDQVGHVTNRYGVRNSETTVHPQIFVCRDPRESWPVLWQMLRRFQ
jgi:hypothetical protein